MVKSAHLCPRNHTCNATSPLRSGVMELNGSTALITGGGRGIGAALAARFAAEGAKVVVADVEADTAAAVAERIGGVALSVDVGSAEANARMIADAEDAVGPIDLLALNAGIGAGTGIDTSDEAWDLIWRVNVLAHAWAVRAWLPSVLERGSGHLLHTVSAAGLLTTIGDLPYSVTKHAAQALAEWLAVTYGDRGLRVSTLNPQWVQTKMLDALKTMPGGAALTSSGVITPEQLAETVVEGLRDERFLILPHPEVAQYEQNRANDRDRWIRGMQKLQARVLGADG